MIKEDTKYIVDTILSLPIEDLITIRKVANLRQEPVFETIKFCILSKCEEILQIEDTKRIDT